ncbi:hypothetical protein ADUPG1_012821, partial [Aduncisulcus paluster]
QNMIFKMSEVQLSFSAALTRMPHADLGLLDSYSRILTSSLLSFSSSCIHSNAVLSTILEDICVYMEEDDESTGRMSMEEAQRKQFEVSPNDLLVLKRGIGLRVLNKLISCVNEEEYLVRRMKGEKVKKSDFVEPECHCGHCDEHDHEEEEEEEEKETDGKKKLSKSQKKFITKHKENKAALRDMGFYLLNDCIRIMTLLTQNGNAGAIEVMYKDAAVIYQLFAVIRYVKQCGINVGAITDFVGSFLDLFPVLDSLVNEQPQFAHFFATYIDTVNMIHEDSPALVGTAMVTKGFVLRALMSFEKIVGATKKIMEEETEDRARVAAEKAEREKAEKEKAEKEAEDEEEKEGAVVKKKDTSTAEEDKKDIDRIQSNAYKHECDTLAGRALILLTTVSDVLSHLIDLSSQDDDKKLKAKAGMQVTMGKKKLSATLVKNGLRVPAALFSRLAEVSRQAGAFKEDETELITAAVALLKKREETGSIADDIVDDLTVLDVPHVQKSSLEKLEKLL